MKTKVKGVQELKKDTVMTSEVYCDIYISR